MGYSINLAAPRDTLHHQIVGKLSPTTLSLHVGPTFRWCGGGEVYLPMSVWNIFPSPTNFWWFSPNHVVGKHIPTPLSIGSNVPQRGEHTLRTWSGAAERQWYTLSITNMGLLKQVKMIAMSLYLYHGSGAANQNGDNTPSLYLYHEYGAANQNGNNTLSLSGMGLVQLTRMATIHYLYLYHGSGAANQNGNNTLSLYVEHGSGAAN